MSGTSSNKVMRRYDWNSEVEKTENQEKDR